jgi:hypothetical protein
LFVITHLKPTRGQDTLTRPGARAHRSMLAMARDEDDDEVKLRGCSPEHGWRQRGGVMTAVVQARCGSREGQEIAQK